MVVMEELDFEERMKRKLKNVKIMVMLEENRGDGSGGVVARVEMVVKQKKRGGGEDGGLVVVVVMLLKMVKLSSE